MNVAVRRGELAGAQWCFGLWKLHWKECRTVPKQHQEHTWAVGVDKLCAMRRLIVLPPLPKPQKRWENEGHLLPDAFQDSLVCAGTAQLSCIPAPYTQNRAACTLTTALGSQLGHSLKPLCFWGEISCQLG